MAFNLKKVLKALLLSSNQPLAIKDIQAVFTRFHEQMTLPLPGVVTDYASPVDVVAAGETAVTPAEAPAAEEPVEVIAEIPEYNELYQEVPSLITATQIREAMDLIAAELRLSDEGLLLNE
jgi:segregation and condensation protein B